MFGLNCQTHTVCRSCFHLSIQPAFQILLVKFRNCVNVYEFCTVYRYAMKYSVLCCSLELQQTFTSTYVPRLVIITNIKQKYHILRFLSTVFITALWNQYDFLLFIIHNLYFLKSIIKKAHQSCSRPDNAKSQSNRIIIKCLENRHRKEEKLMSRNEGPNTAKLPY